MHNSRLRQNRRKNLLNDKDAEDDENPRHTVYLDAFHIDRYEVTNAQYKKFVDANPQWQKDRIPEKYHDGDYLKHWNGNNYPPGKGKHPVVYVSWYAAMAYAEWRGKRLPTEAEWERAARGDRYGRDYAWGDSLDSNKANYGENIGDTTPVGNYDMNGYGLYDMTGNVWEWTADWYSDVYYWYTSQAATKRPKQNPTGPTVGSWRVIRGGSWMDAIARCSTTFRFYLYPNLKTSFVGFRLAKTAL